MSSIRETAEQFFVACETGKGWDGCQSYCHEGATFSSQVGVLEGVDTVEGYSEWMKGLFTPERRDMLAAPSPTSGLRSA